jgi:hypothetical protein
MAKKAKAKRIQSDITLDALLADGWIKTSDPVSPLKKEIINRNPLSAREDSDIKLVVHGMYNDQTFAVLLPDGGMLKVIARAKGPEYLESLKVILKTIGTGSRIRFSNKATGLIFRKPEWNGIGDVYIDQRSGPDGMKCNIYMPVKEGKYLHLISHQ